MENENMMKEHKEENSNKVICEQCEYQTNNKKKFDEHIQDQTIKGIICDLCGVTTKGRGEIKVPINKTHTNEEEEMEIDELSQKDIKVMEVEKEELEKRKRSEMRSWQETTRYQTRFRSNWQARGYSSMVENATRLERLG